MNIFVIHRSKDKDLAKRKLVNLSKSLSLHVNFIFLNSYKIRWKKSAEKAIRDSEAVIIYDSSTCRESENVKWEISKAKSEGKAIIEVDDFSDLSELGEKLESLYNFSADFEKCFASEPKEYFKLYKLMLDSSEQLMQRRQRTNSFFITIIGLTITLAGFLFEYNAVDGSALFILYGFAAVGIFLCFTWRRLIDNYGKLNKAKFDVIHRLEKELDAQIYLAEWIALGKGKRKKKYRSFTSTEKNVPLYFLTLIVALTLILSVLYICF